MDLNDELIYDHGYQGTDRGSCQYMYATNPTTICGQQAMRHADPRGGPSGTFIQRHPHAWASDRPDGGCSFVATDGHGGRLVCGFPRELHEVKRPTGGVVRMADLAQYARTPMPDQARGKVAVTLIDAPTDPLGTLAVLCGIYEGRVARSKAEVTDDQRRAAWEAMRATVLNGPLEAMQFTFLVEGVTRSITHQMVRNRFAFFAQESLRFAVADDWAQEVPLPPSLVGLKDDDPRVALWRKAMNASEDYYGALVGAGMPAEEARGVLPHDIPTRLYWNVNMRALLTEAGKRTCTQAQFPWRAIFGGVAAELRKRDWAAAEMGDSWQYRLFAEAIRPVCYQEGGCGFMAKFDRGCTIRSRVDALEREGVPSTEWHRKDLHGTDAVQDWEWAADPAAARITEEQA